MTDLHHHENVSPLVVALRQAGKTDDEIRKASEWFCDETSDRLCVIVALKRVAGGGELLGSELSDMHFAAGYLQATSNLTGEGWESQLSRVIDEMKE